jgi:hypothetical protein
MRDPGYPIDRWKVIRHAALWIVIILFSIFVWAAAMRFAGFTE